MKPELLTACFTALLHASLLVTGAWVFLLTQEKISAARRSLACRLTIAAALLLTAIRILPALPLLPAPDTFHHTAAPLPQGSGMSAGNLLLTPDSTLDFTPAPTSLSPALPTDRTGFSWQLSPAVSKSIFLLWLAGGIGVGALWCRSLIVRRRVMRESVKTITLPGLEAAATLPGWALVNEVRLIPSEITPCVWGIRKTILALPASATAWPAGKLRLVLAHECAHLLRRDPLWQALTHAFLAMFWFHPLAWNLARRSQAADEQAADDTVLRTTPDAPTYAALLVECARHFSLTHPAPATTHAMATHAMATPANLTTRVEAILTPETDRRPADFRSSLAPFAFLLTVTVAVVCQSPAIAIAETAPPTAIEQTPASPPLPPQTVAGSNNILENPANFLEQTEQKVMAGSSVLLLNKTAKRHTFEFTGTLKLSSAKLKIEADQMVFTAAPSASDKLLTLTAKGNVSLKGTFGQNTLSAVGEEVWISNDTGEMTLTGWPKANLPGVTFNAQKPNAKIILKDGAFSCEGCSAVSPSNKADPVSSALPLNAEAPQNGKDSTPANFPWKVETINGVESISLQQASDYYHFDGVTFRDDGAFQLDSKVLNIKGKSGSADLLINGVRFILNHPIRKTKDSFHLSREDLSNVIDPVLRPSKISGATQLETVVIDAGHGGKDSGAMNALGRESDYTLDTALRLKKALEEAGHKTILTRSDDTFVSLADRRKLADNTKNAIFVSIHFNHGQGGNQGIQTFLPESTNLDSNIVRSSMALATAIHSHLLLNTRSQDAGIQGANFFLLRNEPVNPTVMIDGGYLSHPGDAAKIADASYRESLAQGIAKGIFAYAKSVR